MYTQFYGFKHKPFQLTPDPDFLFLSTVHKRALAYLTYGIRERSGFVAITGEVGAGKTTLIRALLNELDPRIRVAKVMNTQLGTRQLLEMIMADFGCPAPFGKGKAQLLNELNAFLLDQYTQGYRPALIVDEAQNLSTVALEEIRMLSNLETGKDKLLQIILVGQPQLRKKLNDPRMEQLRQRITVNYHLPPLSREECDAYIAHRLSLAAPREAVTFAPEALERIYEYSRGVPRLINVVCDAALLYGFVEETRHLDGRLLDEVIADLQQEGPVSAARSPLRNKEHALLKGLFARVEGMEKEVQLLRNSVSQSTQGLERLRAEIQPLHRVLVDLSQRIERASAARWIEPALREAELSDKIRQMNTLIQRLNEEIEKYTQWNAVGKRDAALGI